MPRRGVVYAAAAFAAAALSVVAAVARPDGADEAEALDGASLFQVKGCATCHVGPDTSPIGEVGPSLVDVSSWAGERVEGLSAEDYVEQSMRDPAAFISPAYRPTGGPDAGMPVLQLSDDEIDDLVEYLLTR
jgi:mono/diheme cytochrome c family protein